MHVRDLPRGEPEVAEHDVLNTRGEERVPVCPGLRGLLADEVEDHRQVVHAERPQCVLVPADLAEVLAVSVEAQDLAQLAGVDELLELPDPWVVQEEVTRHQDQLALLREGAQLLGFVAPKGGRLLDEHVLPR